MRGDDRFRRVISLSGDRQDDSYKLILHYGSQHLKLSVMDLRFGVHTIPVTLPHLLGPIFRLLVTKIPFPKIITEPEQFAGRVHAQTRTVQEPACAFTGGARVCRHGILGV
jgi:hypothetical protein